MPEWSITAERYVAFIDIMGFRSLVLRTPTDQIYRIMKAFHDRARLAEKQAKLMLRETNEGTPRFEMDPKGAEFVRVVQFSDSVVAFTPDTSTMSSIAIRLASMGFIFEGLSARIPLRGAIARGACTADFRHSIFFGQPIVDAYELGEDQQWYGVVEHENCEPKSEEDVDSIAEMQSDEVPLNELHYVSLKSGNRDLCAINWPVFLESEAAVEQALSPFSNDNSPKLHMYYRNTRDFALKSWRKYRQAK
jgi:hypothetical protein